MNGMCSLVQQPSPDTDNPSILRFRLISSFGKGAIRRFPSDVSDMKRRAARHFEDILQVSLISIIHEFNLDWILLPVRNSSI